MFESLFILFLSFMAALSGAVVPGPVFVVTLSESLRRGRLAGPLIVLGHLTLEGLIIIAILFGLDTILGSRQAQVTIGYLGGVMLILMGSYLVKTARSFKIDFEMRPEARFVSHSLIVAGFLSSGSNPQFFLWWLTIGMPIIQYSLAVAGAVGFIAFFLGHAAADLGWFGFVGYSANKGKSFLNETIVRLIIFGSAIFLIIFGISYIYFAYRL